MNAKFILLTHFSQRYSKVPFLDLPNTENIGIAFDNMSVSGQTVIITGVALVKGYNI